jgi:CBS domain-containing protein
MKARDVMTATVVSVGPDTPTREVAKILRDHGISAVPVVDSAGAPIGMISEGDLIGRDGSDREARRDWWLTLLADGEELNPDFLASLRTPKNTAHDVMVSPVITIGEDTEIGVIAKLLTTHRIKRVPVVTDGRIVGIVSRADLVRAFAAEEDAKPAPDRVRGRLGETLTAIDNRFLHLQRHHRAEQPSAAPNRPDPDDTPPTGADFRGLVADHEHKHTEELRAHRSALVEQTHQHVAELIDRHISDTSWRSLMHDARQAAEHGDKEFMLLRFPSQLCGDGGRAINSDRPEWPETLRGEAAELYLRWERDLKPQGFNLRARILDFPGGMPGDTGLFLFWGE